MELQEQLKEMQCEMETAHKKIRDFINRGDASDVTVKASIKTLNEAITGFEDRYLDIKKSIDAVETRMNRLPQGDVGEEQKEKAVLAQYEKAFSVFCRKGEKGLDIDTIKLLATDQDPDGGYFVPQNTRDQIIQKLIEISPVRPLANVETIGIGDSLSIPAEDTDFVTQKGSERVAGAVTDTGKIRMERIPVHIREARPRITQTLLDDSVFNVEAWMSKRVLRRFEVQEGADFINGTGVDEPEGLLTKPSVGNVNGGDAAVLTKSDSIVRLFYSLPSAYSRNATFLLHRLTTQDIRLMKDAQSRYIWMSGISQDRPPTILGAPYVEATDMPVVAANAKAIIFGDIRAAYTIVDRQGIRVLRDVFTQKPLIEFYMTRRYGGQVVLKEALKTLTIAV